MGGRTNPRIQLWLRANGFETLSEVVSRSLVGIDAVRKRILAGCTREEVLAPRKRTSVRAVAWALGCTESHARELCHKTGLDWRTATEQEIDALVVARSSQRSRKWLASLTGYCGQQAVFVLTQAGLDWRTATVDEIKCAIVLHAQAARDSRRLSARTVVRARAGKRRCAKRARPPVFLKTDNNSLTADEWATRLAVRRETVYRWHARGELSRRVERIERGRFERRARRGPLTRVYEAGGLAGTIDEWATRLGLTRQGLWKAARRAGREIGEEIALRVAKRAERTAV